MRTAKILVPLRKSDWIGLFLPYVEQISQPGMKVVFLVQLGQSGFQELTSQLLAIHTGILSAYLPERICEEDALVSKRRSDEQQTAHLKVEDRAHLQPFRRWRLY